MSSRPFHRPPRIPRWILRRSLPALERPYLSGDFDEIYNSVYTERGRLAADAWYWRQLLGSLPWILTHPFIWSLIMFQNYLKTTLRNLKKHKGYSLLNLAGLSVGMACFILILLFVQYEFRYEDHHVNSERIYRIIVEQDLGDQVFRARTSPVPLSETLAQELPEVVTFTRFYSPGRVLVSQGEHSFFEEGFNFADPGVLRMFSFPLVAGEPERALNDTLSAVITEEIAEKYFGREDPMGRTLTLDFGSRFDVTVTGILQNHPPTTNIAPDILVSFRTINELMPNADSFLQNWISQQITSYVMFPENHSVPEMEQKIMGIFRRHIREDDKRVLRLEQLARSHLYSEVNDTGDIRTLYIFLACGILVLLTACINFMNLSTARSANRAKEVGLRKVVGAARGQLIRQFIGESLIYAGVSMLLAVLLVLPCISLLNQLTGQSVSFSDLGGLSVILILLAITGLTGIISGSYPSLLLSGMQPVRVLKGRLTSGARGALFRKILVVAQFSISIILIICTLIFGRQLRYIHNKDLGFVKDRILVVRSQTGEPAGNLEPLKAELLQNPHIGGVSGSMMLPSSIGMYNNVTWEGAVKDEQIELIHNTVDYDFLSTYEIELQAGRNFSPEFPTDARSGRDPANAGGVILNQEAVKRFGWDDAVGRKVIQVYGELKINYTVIGVIKDFHFTSLKNSIRPMNLFLSTRNNRYISVKLQTEDIPGALSFIESTWKRLYPQLPFEHFFLDTIFEQRYRSEERQRQLFGYLSGLAVFIACLGLFGLAAYAAEQRTKEIGIRKVMGASASGIVLLLSKEFTLWVLAANLLAWPAAYWAMDRWLQGFAYRIPMLPQIGFFLLAAGLSLLIAWLTVGFQAVKAALSNPIRSLRYE
ncbi:MAG: ABC transporter permease [Candidatus Aminicenantaceae bacterium]